MSNFALIYFRKFCTLIFVVLLSSTLLLAQENSVKDVLAPLHKANFNINYGDQLNFLLNENQNIPILDKLEFRTETDEMDLSRQEYLFRTSFNSFGSNKIQNKITSNSVSYYQLKDQQLAEIQLKNQYERIVDWYYETNKLDLVKAQLVIEKDKLVVLKKMVTTSQEIDLVNILKLENEIINLERDQLRISSNIEQRKQLIFKQIGKNSGTNLYTQNWISLDQMYTLLTSQRPDEFPSTDQQLLSNRLEEAELALAFENSERKKILDFVQFKYSGRETNLIRNEISFGAGINIPTPSSERRRMNERQIEIFDEQFKIDLFQYKLESELQELLNEFMNIRAEYLLIEKQEKQQDLKGTLASYTKSGFAQPLSLLQINESILDYKKSLHDLEHDACKVYIDYLMTQGKINILSNTNFLSNDLETF